MVIFVCDRVLTARAPTGFTHARARGSRERARVCVVAVAVLSPLNCPAAGRQDETLLELASQCSDDSNCWKYSRSDSVQF